MSAQVSVPVPYGLTDAHRKIRMMGKVTVRTTGSWGGGEIPLLEQPKFRTLPTPPTPPIARSPRRILLPILTNQSKFAPSHRSRREHKIQVHKMAISQAGSRKKHKLPSLQEKRNRVSKPSKKAQAQISRRHRASVPVPVPDSQQASQTDLWRTVIGPGTRVGTTKYVPIIIEDEDSEEQVVNREDSSGRNSFFSATSTPRTQRTSIYASSPSISSSDGSSPVQRPTPSRMRGPWTSMSSPASENGRYREKSIYVDARRETTTSARPLPRPSMTQATFHQHLSVPPATNVTQVPPQRPSATAPPALNAQSRPASQGRQDLTLADISDADIRREVAELMRVAPGLPVQDLFDFLVETKGDVPVARRQAVRASQPPPAVPRIKSEQGQIPGLFSNGRLAGYEYEGDEVMIKIDPNADFLEYDTDSPPPEDIPSTVRYNASKRGGKTKPRAKNVKQSSKPRAGVAVKKKPARKARENSIERDFIDADNVIHLDTDFESTETNSSTLGCSSDTDMADAAEDDIEDLTIDVQPHYAFIR